MVVHARRIGTNRQIRLLLCGFCRQFADQLPDAGCLAALELAEGYADGVVPYRRLIPARVHVETTEWGVSAAFGERSDLATCLNQVLQPVLGLAECDLPQLQNRSVQAALLHCIFGNPFRRVVLDPRWRSESAVALARTAYDTRNFTLLPILADALEDAGCDHADLLAHCRDPKALHARGCWVVDQILGRV